MSTLSNPLTRLRMRWPLLRQIDSGLFIGLLVMLLCLALFGLIAQNVVANPLLIEIDQAVADEMHQQGAQTPNSIAAYKFISGLGLPGIWIMGLVVGLYFLIKRQKLHVIVWAVTLISGILLNNVIKLAFARNRPFFPDPFIIEQQYSFPSGHSMMAVIGFGLLGYFVMFPIQNRFVRIFIIFAIILLILLIGISRMALGVHFFSDVVGGFAAGSAWLALCITVLDQLTRRQLRRDAAAKTKH